MNYLEIAEKFANNIWGVRKEANLIDIMLFGSLTYGKKNPRDIDIMLLHKNPLLDKFQFEIIDTQVSDIEKLLILSQLLEEKINLSKILYNIGVSELIERNIFNTKYMNVDFFTDNLYRSKWIKNNEEHHDRSINKARLRNETFEECIFRQGKLWNYCTGKYNLPAKDKYQVPKDSV